MRSLDLKEFLGLIQEDIKELDEIRRQRRRPEKEEKPGSPGKRGRHKAEPEPEPEDDEEVIPLAFHDITCCGKKLGSFPSLARVRCPFCERWHQAGDFPEDKNE